MPNHAQPAAIDLLNSFNDAFNRHDVDAIMALMTPDCLFDNTFPAPDGTLFQGQAEVRRFWEEFFRVSPHARFEVEELFVSGDRAVQRWAYIWTDAQGVQGHVRGVDLFLLRDGLIAEKRSYVKG
jgi:ketosteroid isomerase-like protein